MRGAAVSVFVWASLLLAASASGQSLGQFSWQLQPYCNVVTVTVTQTGGVYTLDGFDGQCGAAQRAPLTGLATPNPDGTIGFGFSIVASPSGAPVHVAARITLATLSGTWNDSAGASGTFAFGASTGGAPRPAAALSGAQITPGSVGLTQVNTTEVQARITGLCAPTQFVAEVNADGTVICRTAPLSAYASTPFNVAIPSGSTSPNNAVTFGTLTVTPPQSGRLVFRARGSCTLTSLTTGAASAILGLFRPGEFGFSGAEAATIQVPPENPAGEHWQSFDAERVLPATAGVTMLMSFRGYHGFGPTAPFQCVGSLTALFVPAVLQ